MAHTHGELIFRPYEVQKGRGPHLHPLVYVSDLALDAFHSDIALTPKGIVLTDVEGRDRFGVNVRWNVEGFGYLYLTADNGGVGYELPAAGQSRTLDLSLELATSRVARNSLRLEGHTKSGWTPSRELSGLCDIAQGLLDEARGASGNPETSARIAQKSLLYALRVGEAIELEKARWDIARRGTRTDFFFGCDARGYFEMQPELFLERFTECFDYATITHYLIAGVFQDFEPEEGATRFDMRDPLLRKLRDRGITVEGRPLWWSYLTTTPDWLRHKSYDQIRAYVEQHVRSVVSHYGEGMYAWEVVNEFHDWANECRLNPDQIIEITRLACDVARDTNPRVKRLINNCAPFGEYVQMRKMTELDAFYPQRTPYQFLKQLAEAGVDFDLTGIQMYFPYRDLADIIILLEKLATIGKPVHITETGASSGPSPESIASGALAISQEPYAWHRQWDEELQADWMEGLYTLAYSKPWLEAVSWYDFDDPHSWIPNGGFLRSPKGEKRAIVDRFLRMRAEWKNLTH